MRKINGVILATCFLGLTACETLMTRGDVREVEQKRQMQDQVVTLQRSNADTANRFSDIEDDLRSLHGRVEVLENRLAQSTQEREKIKAHAEQSTAESAKKVQILQDEVARMQEQIGALNAELTAVKTAAAEAAAAEKAPAATKKDLFETAEEFFEKKEWKKAILNYQKFRDGNGKNKRFPEATYKIGVSFQELGMKDEARTFYDEVIAKFPNSPEAKKARTRLKSLKK